MVIIQRRTDQYQRDYIKELFVVLEGIMTEYCCEDFERAIDNI